jgi:hypothetical protein
VYGVARVPFSADRRVAGIRDGRLPRVMDPPPGSDWV